MPPGVCSVGDRELFASHAPESSLKDVSGLGLSARAAWQAGLRLGGQPPAPPVRHPPSDAHGMQLRCAQSGRGVAGGSLAPNAAPASPFRRPPARRGRPGRGRLGPRDVQGASVGRPWRGRSRRGVERATRPRTPPRRADRAEIRTRRSLSRCACATGEARARTSTGRSAQRSPRTTRRSGRGRRASPQP
jgi:hypothetical protein